MEDAIMDQKNSQQTSTSAQGAADDGMSKLGGAAKEAFSKTSDIAQEAVQRAKQAASDTASTMSAQVKEMLDQQVGGGADLVGHLANAVKLAARDLDRNAPMLAGIVRGLGDQVESYSGDLRGKSVDDLVRGVSDLTRRQPALVFGIAALAGFFALRTLKATPSVASPSIQPDDQVGGGQRYSSRGPGQSYGGPSQRSTGGRDGL
jgi:hypothetical protein